MKEILTVISFLSGLLVLGLGFFVFGRDFKKKLNLLFLLYCLSISTWLIFTSFMLQSKTNEAIIFWDRMVYLGVVFIPIFVYHFGTVFANREKENKKVIYLGYFLSFIFFILSRTDYFISDVYKYSWGVHTQAKFFHHLFLIFFSVYIFLFFREIYKVIQKAKKEKDKIREIQAKYLFLSFIGFALGSYAFLTAYGIDINPLGAYFGGILAVLLLFFAITKYHLFGIRVILTELLTLTMGILLFTFSFLLPNVYRALGFLIFLLFLIFTYYLIKTVHEEEKRREEAQVLAIREKTLRKRAERLANELERLNRAKDQFILSIQHHLRTPLTPVIGYLSMILEGTYGEISNPKIKEKLIAMQNSVNVLHRLVENLLDVTQLRVGKKILNLEKVKLEDLIEDVVKELMPQATQKGLKIEFEKKQLPEMMLDKMRIREAIFNILDNSIRYTQKGKVKIDLKVEDSNCQIEIQDTGIGMTKEEIENFLKGPLFERGLEAKKMWGPGRGIGLTVALEFVKAHGGEISIFSEGRGKGTTFIVRLPIRQDENKTFRKTESRN